MASRSAQIHEFCNCRAARVFEGVDVGVRRHNQVEDQAESPIVLPQNDWPSLTADRTSGPLNAAKAREPSLAPFEDLIMNLRTTLVIIGLGGVFSPPPPLAVLMLLAFLTPVDAMAQIAPATSRAEGSPPDCPRKPVQTLA